MVAFLIFVSILSIILNNTLRNDAGKRFADNREGVRRYQLFSFFVCVVVFSILACFGSFSLYSVLLGLLFGVTIFASTYFQLLALAEGPMHITILITLSSMLIPTMSGWMFFHEAFSVYKLIAALFLIPFLYLATSNGKGGGKFSKKWFFFCFLSFFGAGMIGILQKIHQTSSHRSELSLFLASAFLVSTLINLIPKKKEQTAAPLLFPKRMVFSAVVSGICTASMYVINTKLSGELPSQLFFPLINGSNMVLSTLVSIFFFKEKSTAKQLVGLIGGFACLIAICLLP